MADLITYLKELDQQLFLQLNTHYTSSFWDYWMPVISNKLVWIPFYFLLVVLVYWKHKNWRILLLTLAVVGLTILLTDQACNLSKNGFARYRPCKHLLLKEQLRLLKDGCGGWYGFVSGHSANSFALATLFFGLLKSHYKYSWSLFIWAGVVAYSRVYIGVHYPLDILGGMVLGILSGTLGYYLFKKVSIHSIVRS